MWLDRLSAHSTPSASPPPPANRQIFPSPSRRPNNLAPNTRQRPSFTSRTSFLSLTTLDAPNTRKPSGAGLKGPEKTQDVSSPLEVLERLLVIDAKNPSVPSKPGIAVNGVEDIALSEEEVDFEGLSLRDLVSKRPFVTDIGQSHHEQTIEECMYMANSPVIFYS